MYGVSVKNGYVVETDTTYTISDKSIYFMMNEGQDKLSLQITLPEKENVAVNHVLYSIIKRILYFGA